MKNTVYGRRPFGVLADHKKLMRLRIEYMSKMNYLHDADYIYQCYSEIEHNAIIMRNLWLKFDSKWEDQTISKMVHYLCEMAEKEYSILERLLNNLTCAKTL